MSTFKHTMMALDRMDRLCREQGIDGHDRVRRLFAVLGHDIGKPIVAEGIHSDDPPTRFGGHDEAGANEMESMCRRLGLGGEIESVMEDAARYHMDFHDVPEMPVNELLSFIDQFMQINDGGEKLPTNPDGETIGPHGITAWEMVDVAHSDHEGRLKVTMRDEIEGTDLVRTMAERPEFEREAFVRSIEAVFNAENEVDGYEALETGLCDEHSESEIDRAHGILEDEEKSVQAVMSRCPECRTPDDWVGQRLEGMKHELMEDELAE